MRGAAGFVCRNNLPGSRLCLHSLQQQTVPLDILIVNNAASDGTASWSRSAQQRDPNIFRLVAESVESVSTLWNRILRWAWGRGCAEVLVLNNDVELRPDTYKTLRGWLAVNGPSDLGLVTGVSAGEEQARGIINVNGISESPHPDFSCFMYTKWAWERVGGFDERYAGAYAEDADLHVRLHRAGVRAVSINVPFVHHRSGTLRNADREERQRIESNALANRKRFFEQYGAWPGTIAYEQLFTAAGAGEGSDLETIQQPEQPGSREGTE